MTRMSSLLMLICTILLMITQTSTIEIKRELYQGDAFQTPGCFMFTYCQARRADLPTSGDRCKCICSSPYLTYHQGVDTCVKAIPECQSLQLGSGSSSPPVVYLPRIGNTIIPNSPLYSNSNGTVALSGMAECSAKRVSVLGDSNTWDSVTYAAGLLIVPIEGKLYFEWKGDIPSRNMLRGNLVKVEVTCILEDGVTQELCITLKIDGTTGSAVTPPENEIEPTEPPTTTTTEAPAPTVQTDPLMQQVMVTLIVIAVIIVIIFSFAVCALCYCRYADKKEIEKRMLRYKEVQENWEFTSSQRSYGYYKHQMERRKSIDSLRSVRSGVLKSILNGYTQAASYKVSKQTSGSVRSLRKKKKRVSFQDTLIVHDIDTSEEVEAKVDKEDEEKQTSDKYQQENYKRHSRYSMHYIKNIVHIGQGKTDENSNSETSSIVSQVDETVKSTKRVSKTKQGAEKTKGGVENKGADVDMKKEDPDQNDKKDNDKQVAQVHAKKSSLKTMKPEIKDKSEGDKSTEKAQKHEVKEENQENVEANEDNAGNDNHGYDSDTINSDIDSDDSGILNTETIVHVPLEEINKSYESSPTDDSQSERTLNTGAENSDNDPSDTEEVVSEIKESDNEEDNSEDDENFDRKQERRLSVKDMVAKYDDGATVIKPYTYKKKEARPNSVYW